MPQPKDTENRFTITLYYDFVTNSMQYLDISLCSSLYIKTCTVVLYYTPACLEWVGLHVVYLPVVIQLLKMLEAWFRASWSSIWQAMLSTVSLSNLTHTHKPQSHDRINHSSVWVSEVISYYCRVHCMMESRQRDDLMWFFINVKMWWTDDTFC